MLTRGGELGVDAAGGVIRAFGEFVAGDQVLVGAILFSILVVIQFVVITRGATRISEVAARFMLDGLPGRQMAIDADLHAGLIDQHEAHRAARRSIARPISSAPWTGPASSCAATPSPAWSSSW